MPNNILLIEPSHPNKYPPLGLMKIAQYHGKHGKNDNVRFIKGEDKSVLETHWDRIYVTTLFSFESKRIAQSIDFALLAANGNADKVFVGGIATSLMPNYFLAKPRWSGIRFIRGLLDKAPSVSLQLDPLSEELYADDATGLPIEDHIPDYSILDQIEYKYPVRDAYFAYASRGCVRKCDFCGVPKLEGEMREIKSLASIINNIERLYGPQKDLILMDNNVVASARFKEIMVEIRELGFKKGAKLQRNGRWLNRRVDFNQGVDARILCKTPMFLRELSTICIKPLRIAFDHIGLKEPYTQAIRYAHEVGLNELSNYMLYNFHDTPKDLFERMRLNLALNEELDIRIFSFPMRYQPTDRPNREHVGEHWNTYWLRSFQIILQATHGVVSGAPTFFKHAFGNTYKDFEDILFMPHAYIMNRTWFSIYGGRAELDSFNAIFSTLSVADRNDLLAILSRHTNADFRVELADCKNQKLRSLAFHYRKFSGKDELAIWNSMKKIRAKEGRDVKDAWRTNIPFVPDDERVEDVGLQETVMA